MSSLFTLLCTYLIGGVTFVPLVLFLIWFLSPKVPSSVHEKNKQDHEKAQKESISKGEPKGYRDLKANEILDKENIGIKTNYSGWVTVTREFYKFPQINADEFKSNTSSDDDLTGSSSNTNSNPGQSPSTGLFAKMMKAGSGNHSHSGSVDDEIKEGDQDTATLGAAKLKQIRRRNRFYGVIKHGNLFLYSDETQKNVKHAIVLDHYTVAMWPRNLTEGQLFMKRSAICLINNNEYKTKEKAFELQRILEDKSENVQPPKNSYFLYGDVAIEKEDWYFALLKATSTNTGLRDLNKNLNPAIMAKPSYYNTADMLDLIETLNATENQLTTKWLNALLGRLFLATYQTEKFQDAFWLKIEERLKKIRTPGFLDQLQINRIDVGHSGPFFTNPKLKSLSTEGDMDISLNVLYQGKAMVEIATKLFINIGVGFKQRQFDIVMKMTINKMEGELLIRMKPQPSSRIWYTFAKMPEIDLSIEPVFSSRAISYGIITDILEKKMKEAIKQSIVYPFFDDFVFFRSPDELFRGGIFDHSVRMEESFIKKNNDSFTSVPLPKSNVAVSNDSTSAVNDEVIPSANVSLEPSRSTGISKFTEKDNGLSKVSKDGNLSKLSTINSEGEDSIETNARSIPSNTDSMDEESSQHIKDSVMKSYTKIKHWYKKTPVISEPSSTTSSPNPTVAKRKSVSNMKDPNYTPPEMISNRRRKPSKLENLQIETQNQLQSVNQHGQFDTVSSGSSSQFLSSNVNPRPSGEAFIKLDRRRGSSQSSQFGSSSFTEENNLPSLTLNSPSSPDMFINEKFKSPTTSSSSASHPNALNYSGKRIISPSIAKFNNELNDITSMSTATAPTNIALSSGLQESPITSVKGNEDNASHNDGADVEESLAIPVHRHAPPLPPRGNSTSHM